LVLSGHGGSQQKKAAGIGVPLAAVEPRIAAAVFGLAGDGLADVASRVTAPVGFLL
jgi:hypothetical protein